MSKRKKAYSPLFENKGASIPLEEAVSKLMSDYRDKGYCAKFDESVDVHIVLHSDFKKANASLQGSVSLPAGTGKKVKIIAFVDGGSDAIQSAIDAGAIDAGLDELIAKVDAGFDDFDVCIATPSVMPKLSKLARKLGPKGLMPNAKVGTVSQDYVSAIKKVMAGQVSFKASKSGCLYASVGRLSFQKDSIVANVREFVSSVKSLKPNAVKTLVDSIWISTTMGPSVKFTNSAF